MKAMTDNSLTNACDESCWRVWRLGFFTDDGKRLGEYYVQAHDECEATRLRPTHVWQGAKMVVTFQ